jgi:hypothetical protein
MQEESGGHELAYQEARRGLDDQERVVSEMRARAGALIAAAAITTSFFGAQAIGDVGVSAAAWLAILCFIGVGFCVLAVLWPRRDWEFDLNPQRFIATYLEPEEREPLELWLIHRDLALHMGASADKNRRQLRVLMIAFRAGAILIILEVIGWVAALNRRDVD